ncbi:MAG TPA: phosphatase PAP2 family protein [Pseudonocardiaceae bacterium]|nr:phosphatase PAP2 family protein [Pseudonocardiaceae bacterium]
MDIDTAMYLLINNFSRHTPWLHGLCAAYALWVGLVALSALLVTAWWNARRQPDPPRQVAVATLTGVATVVSLLANQFLISPVFARPRPCHALAHVEILLNCASDYSMPSDHCVIAGAFVAGLWFLGRGYGVVASALAILLAFSRVYAGVHYPLDTAAGLLSGALICTGIVFGLRRPTSSLIATVAATRLRHWIIATAPISSEYSAPAQR